MMKLDFRAMTVSLAQILTALAALTSVDDLQVKSSVLAVSMLKGSCFRISQNERFAIGIFNAHIVALINGVSFMDIFSY